MTPPRFLPPHYFVLSLILMIGLSFLDAVDLLPQPWPWVGVVPIIIGIALAAQGSRLFSRAGTNIVPFTESTALVTGGVFSFSRNPMYSGMMLALIGTALLLNGILAWLVIIPFFAIIRGYFIKNEEILMEQSFGEEYASYKATVRRWL
jgi:protein-S-isoprenylcysteine O-methyltransferase Ste14